MIVHNFDPIILDLGLIQLRWYSVAYITGIISGWLYAHKIIKNEKLNSIKIDEFDNLIIYVVLGIIIGGRLGYVIFYNFNYYSQNVLEIFKIWQGGMSFHGGLIGVVIGIFIFSKITKTSFFKFTDIISCVAPIGFFLGRIANFINSELVGKISNVPWAVIFPNDGGLSRHPSQIYEAILEGIILFILINFFAFKKKFILKTGHISALFLILYSILRICAEIFREPDKHLGYLFNYFSMGTLLSIVTAILGLLIILFVKKNEQNN